MGVSGSSSLSAGVHLKQAADREWRPSCSRASQNTSGFSMHCHAPPPPPPPRARGLAVWICQAAGQEALGRHSDGSCRQAGDAWRRRCLHADLTTSVRCLACGWYMFSSQKLFKTGSARRAVYKVSHGLQHAGNDLHVQHHVQMQTWGNCTAELGSPAWKPAGVLSVTRITDDACLRCRALQSLGNAAGSPTHLPHARAPPACCSLPQPPRPLALLTGPAARIARGPAARCGRSGTGTGGVASVPRSRSDPGRQPRAGRGAAAPAPAGLSVCVAIPGGGPGRCAGGRAGGAGAGSSPASSPGRGGR